MRKQLGILAIASAAAITFARPVSSATEYSVVHVFNGADGDQPYAGVVFDDAGNIYGTTVFGGSNHSKVCDIECGVVFKLTPDGNETVLHSFLYKKGGAFPYGGPVVDKDESIYGTTVTDLDKKACAPDTTCSIVYTISPAGDYSIIHHFKSASDGGATFGALISDKKGELYGTAAGGGPGGQGTVFEFSTDGTLKVLHAFSGGDDGAVPESALLIDQKGNLYGTTTSGGGTGCGGTGCGTVFKIAPDGTESILHSFSGDPDGASPQGNLLFDKNGNLYGTTAFGGRKGNNTCYNENCGTVFKLTPDGTETVLWAFANGSDGAIPYSGLLIDKKGNLFGTTSEGGVDCDSNGSGCGTVFKLTPAGKKTVLHAFTGDSDGEFPVAGLTAGQNGYFFGTTEGYSYGSFPGTVFKIKP